jgi:zinc transporter ZupT
MDYLILLSSIILGALSVFLFKLDAPRHVKLLNAFTGAYLLTLTMLHLLPEIYETGAGAHDNLKIGGLMLAGFFTQIALDVFSMGIEHGHTHHIHHRIPFGVLAGLCLHALIEAMALGTPDAYHDLQSRKLLLWSIVLHNYPVAIALLGMLLHSGIGTKKSLGLLAMFAAMAPLGMMISAHTSLAAHSRELMAFVIGIFMHISTTILFESGDVHQIKLMKVVAIAVGTLLGIGSVLIH